MPDELSHGDLLSHSVVQAVAVEHHALQDGERALQDGNVHHGLVHVACDLSVDRREGEETSFSVSGANSTSIFKTPNHLRAQCLSPSESCSYMRSNVRTI